MKNIDQPIRQFIPSLADPDNFTPDPDPVYKILDPETSPDPDPALI